MGSSRNFFGPFATLACDSLTYFKRRQFARYFFVGVGNTAFSYGTYAALLFFGLDYRVASLLSLVLGIAVSFTTQSNLVFHNATRITLVKFIIAWLFMYVVNIGVISGLIRLSLSAYIAGGIAIVPVTLISYFVLKFAVFGRKKSIQSADSIK